MRFPFVASVVLVFLPFLAGCERGHDVPTAPAAASVPSTPSPPQPTSHLANWTADATVLSVTNPGHACGWGTTLGETTAGIGWRVTIDADSVVLDEDMSNWPTDDILYSGTVSRSQFTAAYASGSDYLRYVCQFKGATLSGNFSADFLSFEALETLVWGPPGQETTVQRRWIGSRLAT